MKKVFLYSFTALTLASTANHSFAQATVAMDFNRADCNGTMHHLFTNDLDSGNVVILEYFMGGGCTGCITAGHALETMKTGLLAAHPGKIRSYVSGFQNTPLYYNCAAVSAWVTTNSMTSTPMDSGAAQVAYYGGFGMPTIVIVAGTTHKVIYTGIGYTTGDTTKMKDSIYKFFNPASAGVSENNAVSSFGIYPNPAGNTATLKLTAKTEGNLNIQITDIAGKLISAVVNEAVSVGEYSKSINTTGIPNGLYMVRVTLNGHTTYSKLTVAR